MIFRTFRFTVLSCSQTAATALRFVAGVLDKVLAKSLMKSDCVPLIDAELLEDLEEPSQPLPLDVPPR
eukprot:1549089-Amphidinium_carterae.1